MKYQDYLNSPSWKTRRTKVILDQRFCQICGSNHYLNVHHRSYHNGTQKNVLGNEPEYLLTLLCQDCHTRWHRLYGRIKLRLGKINNIKTHLLRGLDKETAFLNCGSKIIDNQTVPTYIGNSSLK